MQSAVAYFLSYIHILYVLIKVSIQQVVTQKIQQNILNDFYYSLYSRYTDKTFSVKFHLIIV